MDKTGVKETKWLFVLLVLSRVILNAVSVLVENSGTAGYINAFCGFGITILAVLLINHGLKGRDIFSTLDFVFGRKITGIFLFVLFVLTAINCADRINMFSKVVKGFMLSETPSGVILLMFGLAVFAAVHFRLEAITRYAFLTGIALVVFCAVLGITACSEAKLLNICPVLGKGRVTDVLNMLYIFSDVFFFYVILGKTDKSSRRQQAIVHSVIISGALTVFITLFYSLCVPYPASGKYEYPLFRLAALANSSVVFQRLDGFVYILWIIIGFISVGALASFMCEIFCRLFGLKDKRGVESALVFSVFMISLLKLDLSEVTNTAFTIVSFVAMPLLAVCTMVKEKCLK